MPKNSRSLMDNMVHITEVKKINSTLYRIMHRLPDGASNSMIKHEPAPSDTMTLDQIIHMK